MGKNYYKELTAIEKTADWAKSQSVEGLTDFINSYLESPSIYIASGGSFSACAFAEALSLRCGQMAKAVTPYTYIHSGLTKIPSKVLLISASGKNKDINRAFCEALESEKQMIAGLSVGRGSILSQQFEQTGNKTFFGYPIPTRHDGFLATNSLVAFYIFLYRAFGYNDLDDLQCKADPTFLEKTNTFVEMLKNIETNTFSRFTAFLHKLEGIDSFFILYSPYSQAAALDLESKFSEAAIGNTQLADFRNFAHGRHNWFTQRPGQTGIICLVTPQDKDMAYLTLSFLPEHIPVLILESIHESPLAMIDLLIKGFHLCHEMAMRWGLEIGNPAVPPYGVQLYNL